MDALKALLDKKRKATQEEFGGRKFVKRSEIEKSRLEQLKEQEAKEQAEKVHPCHVCPCHTLLPPFAALQVKARAPPELLVTCHCPCVLDTKVLVTQEARRQKQLAAAGSGELGRLDSGPRGSEELLPQAEVIRRLRLLAQPATLFGEVSLACKAQAGCWGSQASTLKHKHPCSGSYASNNA